MRETIAILERMNCVAKLFSFTAILIANLQAADFKSDILPIVEEHCMKCHSGADAEGGIAFDDLEGIQEVHIHELGTIRPGNPEKSDLLLRLKLDDEDEDFMPKDGKSLSSRDIAIIEKWIVEGAIFDKEAMTEKETARIAKAEMANRYFPWTNLAGKTLEARFIGIEGESVKIIMANGREYTVPFESLTPESVAQAKELATQ